MAEDWRLAVPHDYLLGREMRHTEWSPYREGWDHDHCDFCFAEISDDTTGHADYNVGWVDDATSYWWVCGSCFEDFRELFNWSVVP